MRKFAICPQCRSGLAVFRGEEFAPRAQPPGWLAVKWLGWRWCWCLCAVSVRTSAPAQFVQVVRPTLSMVRRLFLHPVRLRPGHWHPLPHGPVGPQWRAVVPNRSSKMVAVARKPVARSCPLGCCSLARRSAALMVFSLMGRRIRLAEQSNSWKWVSGTGFVAIARTGGRKRHHGGCCCLPSLPRLLWRGWPIGQRLNRTPPKRPCAAPFRAQHQHKAKRRAVCKPPASRYSHGWRAAVRPAWWGR